MNILDATIFGVPPPWKKISIAGKSCYYMNDITGQIVDEHPLQAIIDEKERNRSRGHENTIQIYDHHPDEKNDRLLLTNDENNDISNIHMDEEELNQLKQIADSVNANELSYNSNSDMENQQNNEISNMLNNNADEDEILKQDKYVEFRCNWKEKGLFGNTNAFSLLIRYFADGRTAIQFDGIDGKWEYSTLQGPYGPVDRYDLFVGSKIKIFGRHLTISSCNATVCHAIEMEGKKLMKKQHWLQSRIESVGGTPVVKRRQDAGGTVIRNIERNSKSYGSCNLRRLYNMNCKLKEQLVELGLIQLLQEHENREREKNMNKKAGQSNWEGTLLYGET